MKLLRLVLKAAVTLTAFLAGCSSPSNVGMYGIVPAYGVPNPPGDPTVEIVDFSYEPANPVTAGTGILFTATLNKPFNNYYGNSVVDVQIGDAADPIPGHPQGTVSFSLSDRGGTYDEVAGDLIYSGAFEWRVDYGAVEGLPVIAKLDWYDDTPDVIFTGEPLTVVEGEE